jgi:hypothetical protein
MGEHMRIRLETDRTTYHGGEQARLYAHVLDENYEPVSQPSFEISVTGVDGNTVKQSVSLQPDRTTPGLYEGFFTPSVAGRYRVEANEDDKEVSNTTEFQVADVKQELNRTDADIDHMKRIASLTGGANLGIRDLAKLPSLLKSSPVETTVRSERPLWDNWIIVLVLVALLGTEWILRRKHDLP